MEIKNQKSKIYLIIFIAILLLAIILSITREVNAPVVVDKNENVPVSSILGNKEDLVFLSIVPGTVVNNVLSLTGEVKGGYFFEGNILINVLDTNKNLLRQGHGTATTDWMTSGPVTFTADVDFSGLFPGSAYLEIHNDNASGLPENDKNILIPIKIE